MGHFAVTTAIAAGRVVVTGGADWGGFKKAAKEAGDMAMSGMADANAEQKKSGGEDIW